MPLTSPSAKADAGGAVAQEIVKIAADFAGGKDSRGEVHAEILGGNGPQQGALHDLGGVQFALHAGFVARDFLVEAGVFDGDSQLRGEDGERLHMIFGEIVQLRAFQIDHAHDCAFVDHGNGQLRARFGIDHAVARLLRDVRNANRQCAGGGHADDAFAKADGQLALGALAVLDRQTLLKERGGWVIEHDAHDLVVDHALDELARAAQQNFQLQDGGGFAADLMQHQKRIGLAAGPFEEARVFDGRGQPARQEHQNFLLLRGEVIDLGTLDIDDANDLVLEDQRHGQLGANAIDGVDVARIGAHVANENGLAAGGGRSGDALPYGEAPGVQNLLAVAHRETVGEGLSALVEQHYREDLVIDQALDEGGRLGEDAVEIQGSVDLLADFGERGEDTFRQFLSNPGFDVGHGVISPAPTV